VNEGARPAGFPSKKGWSRKDEAREIEALLHLKEIPRLGDRRIWALVQSNGSAVGALKGARTQTRLWGGGETAFPVAQWRQDGSALLPITSPHYPECLLALADPPPLLFLKGREELLTGPAVAVVGARKATEGGRRAAEALGRVLAGAGITVVSGLARGIDGAAHRGALEGGGKTVAVLGSGLRVVYPPTHRALFRDIGSRGLLVSEFLPTEPALPHHFPKRNRIIAALAQAVVVVEAGKKSGALITVDHGLDLGREILAFPGSMENPQAVGSNALLREGARILTSPEAILEELPGLVEAASGTQGKGGDAPPAPPELPAELFPLWVALALEPRGVDELAGEARLAPHEALAGLSILELMGRACRCPGMRFRRGAP